MKVYRILVTLPNDKKIIYRVKANSYVDAELKLKRTFKFEEMLSDSEIKDAKTFLDTIIDTFKTK